MTVAATTSLAEAARRTWDAVVVGAGPAGAMAAHELARRGCGVLLVDRATFPRWKVCGCCLNGHALATLRAAGLGELPAQGGAVPLNSIRLAAAGRIARVPLSSGVSLSRETFDAALVSAAIRAGTAFMPLTHATLTCAGRAGNSGSWRYGKDRQAWSSRPGSFSPPMGWVETSPTGRASRKWPSRQGHALGPASSPMRRRSMSRARSSWRAVDPAI